MIPKDIFQFITTEEAKYKLPVDIIQDWRWSMVEHIKTSIFYKNGRLLTGNSDDKPVKNIILPIINLEYRAEDIDVKDIELYVDDPDYYHLSFLIKKYHDDVFVIENDIDTWIDREKEEKIDLGASLIKDVSEPTPDIVHLQDIAFCNQNDILSNPIGILHLYSPDQLKEFEDKGWGDKNNGATATIDEVITLVGSDKKSVLGNDIKVYEVQGMLPDSFMGGDPYKYTRQMHIVCFYHDDKGNKNGLTLFNSYQKENPFDIDKRDEIYNRAVGRGGIEELFESQVWTTYSMQAKKRMLDAASVMILQTSDSAIKQRHPSGLRGVDNLEIIETAENKPITQVDTYPRNFNLFDLWDKELAAHAQQTGAANDAIMGESPKAQTPFALQELVTAESHGLHDYRIGKHAKFLERFYRRYFIPHIIKQITKGTEFLSELTLEEMQEVADKIIIKEANKYIKDKILSGKIVEDTEIEIYKQKVRDDFMKNNKKFLEILKDEFKGLPIKIKINIKGKQKNLAQWATGLTNIMRQVISAPQILDNPKLAKLFNQIIEASGFSPLDWGSGSNIAPTTPNVALNTPQQATEALQGQMLELQNQNI